MPLIWSRRWLPLPLLCSVASCSSHPATAPQPPRPVSRPVTPRAAASEPPGRFPPVPLVRGPLRLDVVYPPRVAVVAVEDSSFLLGSVGDGTARLTVNGTPVPVWPNGAFIAWLPFPPGPEARFTLVARTATDSVRLAYSVRRVAETGRAHGGDGLWVDTTSFAPRGRVWWPGEEYLTFSVRAADSVTLALVLPGGARVPLSAASPRVEVPEAVRAFESDTGHPRRPVVGGARHYETVLRGTVLGDALPGVLDSVAPPARAAPPASSAVLEAVRGGDTLRLRWPLSLALLDTLPVAAQLDDDPLRTGATDGITVGRAAPAATYHWFFPRGTVALVAGRVNGDLRLRLSSGADAWVAAAEARPAPAGGLAAPAVVGSIALVPRPDRVEARIPLTRRVPYQVEEEERAVRLTLYGAASDVNWLRYGRRDDLVALAAWRQATRDQVELRFELSRPVWGWRVRWDGDDLLLDLRRPPVIDPEHPLRGRTIVLDPGHPPIGATGPTGLSEAEANLAVARALAPLLQAEGARVLLTRSDPRPIELWPRVRFADSVGAELLVSLHNDALPDGINPFANSGSHVFYFHPRSLPLARAIQDRFVARLGLRDLGVARGDLALVRPTWMPAVLTEGLFLILPEHEAALRSPEGQGLYAQAVYEGIERFLRERAGEGR